MDNQALFKINCGLYVAAVDFNGKVNALITNTLMQQSHAPVKISITLEKTHLTHDMVRDKKTVGVSALSSNVTEELIKRFGFVSGRDKDKFEGMPYTLDVNGNPLLDGEEVSANFSLEVYDQIDVGSHTMFMCTVSDMKGYDNKATTYSDYREKLRNKNK